MGSWVFDFTLISAKGLPDVREFGRMKVYAEIGFEGKPETTYKTPVDYDGETNPTWNVRAPYQLDDEDVERDDLFLIIILFCERSFLDDKYVGSLKVPFKQLFVKRNGDQLTYADYPVYRGNQNSGILKFSYRIYKASPSTVISGGSSERKESSGEIILKEVASEFVKGFVSAALESVLPGSSTILSGD